ncbi:M23 family metallopeptidase [Glaciihabitans sp. INWT7]|uniref:M23 family metallopeptidase n=1 Tax=Glaciihabitans sp. INWT7 TaxID=2596912 RepID=UPI0016260413|nr:M23 family metallopeptidase [Glaciihabitans sp. INWT7]QNE48041.1 M23 family metallopeptidase [Glaciihabitans sp. INWT7]
MAANTGGTARRSTRRPLGRLRRWTAVAAVFSVLASGSIVGSSTAAFATTYPSYADVQNAQRSEAAKKAEIATLNQLLATLQSAVDSTQADAVQKGAAAEAAQAKYDDAAAKAVKLKSQADEAQAQADRSKQQAGELAARLARSGGSDLSSTLFFDSRNAKSLLSQLGLASMVKDQSAGIYEKAIQNQNVARALTDQADIAKEALKALAGQAEKAAQAAADAAVAAAAALTEQQAHQVELDAQLAILVTNTTQTEADYATGVEAARQAAAAALAAQLAAAPRAGQISSAGWARPAGGHISSPYGYRIDPYNGVYALHAGTDLAAGCNTPIYAAHSGTIVLAGPYGGYGNYIRIRNDGDSSYETAYGHIVNGGILVRIGQHVEVGQNIARVGSTGMSTGCHLHFEIHHNGGTQDPVPFMRSNGVELAN